MHWKNSMRDEDGPGSSGCNRLPTTTQKFMLDAFMLDLFMLN